MFETLACQLLWKSQSSKNNHNFQLMYFLLLEMSNMHEFKMVICRGCLEDSDFVFCIIPFAFLLHLKWGWYTDLAATIPLLQQLSGPAAASEPAACSPHCRPRSKCSSAWQQCEGCCSPASLPGNTAGWLMVVRHCSGTAVPLLRLATPGLWWFLTATISHTRATWEYCRLYKCA